MQNILVLYYSMYGHVETLAYAIADGVGSIEGCRATVKRVPELMPREAAEKAGAKLDQPAPIAEPLELADYDAIILGTPTRFGNMSAQMRNFLDQTGALWARGALVGKPGSAFTSTGTQHAGQETTITSVHTTLLHHGMLVVGVPSTCPELSTTAEITGGSIYGAGTIAGGDGSRQPTPNELAIARFQGAHVARIAQRLGREEA